MTWQTPPVFVASQPISAEGHLNGLANLTNALLGAYRRNLTVWPGGVRDAYNWDALQVGDQWRRVFDGIIRHRADTLSWGVRVNKDSGLALEIRITYGTSTTTSTVAAGSGLTTASGTIDVSAQSGFYPAIIDVRPLSGGSPVGTRGDLEVWPWYLCEVDPPSFAALHRFYTGDTPTAAQWQALSDRLTDLHEQAGDIAGVWLAHDPLLTPNKTTAGTVVHRNETIMYDLRVRIPAVWPTGDPENNQQEYATLVAVVRYNDEVIGARGYGVIDSATLPGTVVMKDATYFSAGQRVRLQSGQLIQLGSKATATFTGCTQIEGGWRDPVVGDWLHHEPDLVADPEPEFVAYSGQFSLTGLTLTEGTRYQVTVTAYYNDHSWGTNTVGAVRCLLLAEAPSVNPTLTGWTAMPTFAQGDAVAGAGSVKTVRDNITWLSSRMVLFNDAAPRRYWWQGPVTMVREKRWLHYFCSYDEAADGDPPSPEIQWAIGKEWRSARLPYEPNKWLKYDLDRAERLYHGTAYRVLLPGWCLEDEQG